MSFLSAMNGFGLGRPSPESATAASAPRAAGRHPRQSSQAAYNVFEPSQIQTFMEAFKLIDTDSDGYISKDDLSSMLTSLGQNPTSSQLASYFPSASPSDPSPKINFTAFVTLMAERLSLLDTETDLVEAFASFDEDDTGVVEAKEIRQWLRDVGDRMTDAEIDKLLSPPFLDNKGMFHYKQFCETLRVTDVEADAATGVAGY